MDESYDLAEELKELEKLFDEEMKRLEEMQTQ